LKQVRAGVLDIAYFELGPEDGIPTILLHGFPYDAHAYDGVASNLAASGHRCIVPFLRGYGATRFLSPKTLRSGEQAALGADLLEHAMRIARALPQPKTTRSVRSAEGRHLEGNAVKAVKEAEGEPDAFGVRALAAGSAFDDVRPLFFGESTPLPMGASS
jgi:hypothetical protein